MNILSAPAQLSVSRKKSFRFSHYLAILALFSGIQHAAATTILATSPTNTATGIEPWAPVVFTFSAAMNPANTTAQFFDVTAGLASTPVFHAWSSGNTVLTCTPSPQFANGHTIEWQVSGIDALSNALSGATTGFFTNVAGVNGGSGTNAFTFFVIGEYAYYSQTNTSSPVHLTGEFFAETLLASNRTATAVTLTLPSSAVSNLNSGGATPEKYTLPVYVPSQATLSSNFPPGSYTFNVSGSSPQTATVTYPVYSQPNTPQLINFTAAQSINPAQPFTFTWNTFTNGTSADLIFLLINLGGGLQYTTPYFSQPDGIPGTATSYTLPAGILAANTNYNADLVFFHYAAVTNGGTVTGSFLGTVTAFPITTVGASVPASPKLTVSLSGPNAILAWPTNATGFRLESTATLASPSWNTNYPAPSVLGTNNVITNPLSGPQLFFRLISP